MLVARPWGTAVMGQEPAIVTTEHPTFEAGGEPGRSALGRVLAQQAAIAEMAQRALEEPDLGRLLDEVCVLVGRVLETELVDVLELSADARQLRVVAGVGWRPGVVGQLTLPAARGSMSGFTLASGEPVIATDLAAERRFTVSSVLHEHDVASGISVRIGGAEQAYGVLAAFTSRRREFSHDDAFFLQSMANVLGSAVARLRAEAGLRRSRDEMATILANVTDGITVQRADGSLVFANDAAAHLCGFDSGPELLAAPVAELMARFELLDEQGHPLPAEQLPGRVSLLSGRQAGPTAIRFRVRQTGDERWSLVQAAPVLDGSGQVEQVINVFRDITAEHHAEVAQRLVTQTVEALSATLSMDEAARRLAELCVPRLADFAVVDLLELDGSIRTAAIAHVDPTRVGLAWQMRQRQPLQPGEPAGPAQVMRDGTPEVLELDEALLRDSIPNPEVLEVLLRLGVRGYMCVPLRGRGRTVGALTLVMAESGRRFAKHDLGIATEVASRAGVAIENARLYETAEERRGELDAVVGAMAEAVLLFDERGELRLGNRAAARLFRGAVPATITELDARLDPPLEDASASDPSALEGERRLAASGRWLEVNAYRPRGGRAGGQSARSSVVVLRDVTEARTAQVARDAFIGVLSHELRTPITTIYGGSELLERNLPAEQQAEIIADIRAEAERLARLVEDLLVMSRVERGVVEIGDEPVLIQRLLPPLIESLTARWPALAVRTALADALPAVRGDATYLEQVLRNLLTNAIRYGEALTTGIDIEASADEGRVTVRVLDHGPGPGTDVPERLFDLFYRAPAARTVPGGAGIGLFVCRQLVEAMGGSAWARARDGGGTEMGFDLPVIEDSAG
jgi:PAS domain S-box-containing protein